MVTAAKAVEKAKAAVAKATVAIAKAKHLSESNVRHENADIGCMVTAIRGAARTLRKEDRVRRGEYVQLELLACCKEQRGTRKSIRVAAAAQENCEALRRFVNSGCKVLVTRDFTKKRFGFDLQLFATAPHQEQLFTDEDINMVEYENRHRVETAAKRFEKMMYPKKKHHRKCRGKHRGNKRLIYALKPRMQHAKAYKIYIMPNKTQLGFYAVLDVQNMDVTELVKPYLVNNINMTTISGREIVAERALDGVALLDYSAMDICNKEALTAGARAIKGNLIVGKIRGSKYNKVYFEENSKEGNFIYSLIQREEGADIIVDSNKVYDIGGTLHKGLVKYEIDINSSSQGKNDQLTMFSDPEKFLYQLNEVTYGESRLTFSSGIKNANGKEIADKCTRVGSKSCPMGATETKLNNAVIVLEKDPNLDGTGLINATTIARAAKDCSTADWDVKFNGELIKLVEGYTVQFRPWTVKAAARVVSPIKMNVIAAKHNIYTIDLDNISELDELVFRLSLDKVAKAHASKKDLEIVAKALEGYDAIGLKGDDSGTWEIYGDLNFYKDAWDLKKTRESGLNILAFGHYDGERVDFNGANTNAQLLKCVMNAVASSDDPEFLKYADEVIKSVIDCNVSDLITLNQKPESFDGSGWMNTSYLPGVMALLNPETYTNNYSVMYTLVDQKLNAANKVLNKDSYKVPGNNGMITVDAAYWYIGKSLLESYVDKQGRFVFEVFNPVFEAYAKKHPGVSRNGIAIKNPSVGTCEFALVKYVSLEELRERCDKQCDKYADLVFSEYVNFKEGGVMIPAALEVIALINAGLDLDGDKMIFFFAKEDGKDFATVMWKSGLKPRAVRIGTPGKADLSKLTPRERAKVIVKQKETEAPLNPDMFKTYAAWNLQNNNRGTGTVTNTIAIFTSLLIQWKLSKGKDKNVKKFGESLFKELGCVSKGGKDYKSVIKVYVENGIEIYETSATALEDFFEAIKGVNISKKKNILAMLEDLDVLGRHCQELTIDAQKKFYIVFCAWIDTIKDFAVAKNHCSIELKLDCSPDGFYAVFETGCAYSVECDSDGGPVVKYKLATEKVFDPKTGDLLHHAYIADPFVEYRVYAAQKIQEAISDTLILDLEIARELQIAQYKADRDFLARAKTQWANPEGIALLAGLERKMITVDQSCCEREEAFKKRFESLSKGYGKKMKKRLYDDMKKSLSEEYGVFINAIDNEARKIMRAVATPEHKVLIFDSLTFLNRKLSASTLKPERFAKLCEASKNNIFKYELSHEDGELLIALGDGSKIVANDGFVVVGEKIVEAPLLDGVYTICQEEERVYLTRPYSEFIEIPEIDEDLHFVSAVVKSSTKQDEIDKATELAGKAKQLFGKKNAKMHFTSPNTKTHKTYVVAEKGGEEILELNLGEKTLKPAYKNIGCTKAEYTLRANALRASKAYRDGAKIVKMATVDKVEWKKKDEKHPKSKSKLEAYYWNFAFVVRA